MDIAAKIILRSGKDQSLARFHPWVFSGAIKKMHGNPLEGDLVKVYDNKDNYLATGHFQPGSIAVRILTFRDETIDDDFWEMRIIAAWTLRDQHIISRNSVTNVFRLINAEGDGFPGLICDFYNGTLVMQAHSYGMYLIRQKLAALFKKVLGELLYAVYDKSSTTLSFKSPGEKADGFIIGNEENSPVTENGIRFFVDYKEGQKTGFFIDQRDNRQLLRQYALKRNVLNMFCYTGGFSIYALDGGANLVHSVDTSKPAIDMTQRNVDINFPGTSRHQAYTTDAFAFLDAPPERYDLIVLDPPAFAKHHNVLHNALQGYKRLNMKAFSMIQPGGILFTFSCSQVVNRENFRKSVFAAAANANRQVKILHQLSQPPDHPVSIYHPEGEYLKGLVLYVG
ncbi:MAG: class I SAM-dependent rRNA methyltransferase [Bacteroidota bacterium]